jgi:hypothetical protein
LNGIEASSEASKEFGKADFESAGDLFDIDKGDVPLTSFDGSHVGTMQIAAVSEFFLRNACSLSSFLTARPNLGPMSSIGC